MNANDRSIVGLVMVAHAMVHTYELSIPIFMTIWLAELGVSEAVLGTVVGAGYALFGAGALPGGVLADRFGSRRLIAFCLAGMGGAFVLLSLAQTVWTVGLALLAWGAAASVYHPAGLSLISRGVRERGEALAWHGIAGNVGIAAGPLATALLLLAVDWQAAAALLALPAVGATAYAWRASFDEHAAEDGRSAGGPKQIRELMADSRRLFATGFAAVFAIVMLSGLYYRGALTFLPDLLTPLVALDLPVDLEPGRYVYAGLLGVGIVGQYVGGRLTDRMPTERAMAGALGALAVVALAFLPVAQLGTGPLLAASAVLGFALFLVQPLYQATVAEYTPAETRGLSYGFTYLGVFGVGALGAALAGAVLQYASAGALFAVLAAMAGAGAGLSAWLAGRGERKGVATPASRSSRPESRRDEAERSP
jgi:MFS family permease